MQITSVITEKVKDAVALSKSIAKVVKEEIELYLDKNKTDEETDETEEASCEKEEKEEQEDKKSVILEYIETFETKAKDLIKNSFSGFKSSKKEDQVELEARISALEEKLSKLVEDSLKAIRK